MRNQHGFSLTELLFALGVSSILGVLALPGLSGKGESAEASAVAASLHRALQHARTVTRTHARRYRVCGSDDGELCSKNWSKMLLLFDDANDNDSLDEDELVQLYPIDARHTTIQTRLGFGKKIFTFNHLGRVDLSGSFLLCRSHQDSDKPLRKVTWSRIGRPYVLKSEDKVAAHSSLLCS